MLLFLLQQVSGSSEDTSQEPDDNTTAAEEQTTTNWNMLLCLAITVLTGGFILLSPWLLQKFFRCVIWIRFGHRALPSRTNKIMDDVPVEDIESVP